MTGPLQTACYPSRFKVLNLGAQFILAVIAFSGLGWAGGGAASDFRSVAENAAVLYDAPSAKAKKLYVVSHGYPVEVLVVVEGWSKVRDAAGELTWIESKQLSDKRTVMVRMPLAQVREAADDNAPVAFQAQQSVLLELLEVASGGWLRVRHRDGQTGYVRVAQVWGA
ncbi:MAG: SH3 domain-containing protein [Burkholderiales bacterium]